MLWFHVMFFFQLIFISSSKSPNLLLNTFKVVIVDLFLV